jgi:hypothetical protein
MEKKKGPGSVLSVLRVFPCTDKRAHALTSVHSRRCMYPCAEGMSRWEGKNERTLKAKVTSPAVSFSRYGCSAGHFQMTYYTILRYVALRCTSINSYTVDLMAGQPRYYVPSIYRIIVLYTTAGSILCAPAQ